MHPTRAYTATSVRASQRAITCPELSRRAYFYGSVKVADVLRRVERVRLWHYCGVHKLERLPRCVGTAQHPFCATRVMRLFQWLQLQANPCVARGSSAATCAADAQCRWCSDAIRCVPSSWSCHAQDNATLALESRMAQPRGMGTVRPGWCSVCIPWHRGAASGTTSSAAASALKGA